MKPLNIVRDATRCRWPLRKILKSWNDYKNSKLMMIIGWRSRSLPPRGTTRNFETVKQRASFFHFSYGIFKYNFFINLSFNLLSRWKNLKVAHRKEMKETDKSGRSKRLVRWKTGAGKWKLHLIEKWLCTESLQLTCFLLSGTCKLSTLERIFPPAFKSIIFESQKIFDKNDLEI